MSHYQDKKFDLDIEKYQHPSSTHSETRNRFSKLNNTQQPFLMATTKPTNILGLSDDLLGMISQNASYKRGMNKVIADLDDLKRTMVIADYSREFRTHAREDYYGLLQEELFSSFFSYSTYDDDDGFPVLFEGFCSVIDFGWEHGGDNELWT